jgi:hypothetical protein
LTDRECSILKYLYRAGGKAVPRQVLLNEVWGYNSLMTTHTLETHIYRLRQKIEADPSRPSLLLTQSGSYKLVATATPDAGINPGIGAATEPPRWPTPRPDTGHRSARSADLLWRYPAVMPASPPVPTSGTPSRRAACDAG